MSTLLPQDYKKLTEMSPDQLIGLLANGEPESPHTFAVKSLIEIKLQQGLLGETKKMAWVTIIAACIPAAISLLSVSK